MTKQDWARPAVLLNPLEGDPTEADSHIGGPMLWPIDEPWPYCEGATHEDSSNVEEEDCKGVRVPFVGALQFYRKDFPELPFPPDIDLLQVFLCTLEHSGIYGPDVRLVWRDSTKVVEMIEEEPQPSVQEPEYVPTVNVFEPIRYVEYAKRDERPEHLRDEDWPEVSTGSKIGGWTSWWAAGPLPFPCRECGANGRQTLALATHEPSGDHVEWAFGKQGILNIITCPRDVHHPITVHID